jgi:hypothetical protein
MDILYHHRTQGTGAEGVHIAYIIKGFRDIAVHLSVFEPVGGVLGNSSPPVIPGFRNGVYELRMPRKVLSGQTWIS